MVPFAPGAGGARRRGYTLIEMAVTSFLMTLLSMLLILAWKAFGVPAVEVESRARVAAAASLAAESLGRDLGGYQVRKEGKSGPDDQVRVDRLYRYFEKLPPDGLHPYPIRLHFQREDQGAVMLTISYYVDQGTQSLVRLEEESGALTIVATHVTDLALTAAGVINFTVSYRRFRGTFAMSVIDPP
jgi:prepilin-type N-terminal cleavage/methylation domain-containing protein